MKSTSVYLISLALAMLHALGASSQGDYSDVQNITLNQNSLTMIKDVLCTSKSDSIYNIMVSKCHLKNFYCHLPNCKGDTVRVQKDGYRIIYNHQSKHSPSESGITLFLSEDTDYCYRSLLFRFGFPPSYSTSASIEKKNMKHINLLKIINSKR